MLTNDLVVWFADKVYMLLSYIDDWVLTFWRIFMVMVFSSMQSLFLLRNKFSNMLESSFFCPQHELRNTTVLHPDESRIKTSENQFCNKIVSITKIHIAYLGKLQKIGTQISNIYSSLKKVLQQTQSCSWT